jgi:hypothetical protein
LRDRQKAEKKKAEPTSINPLILYGILSLSLLASVAIVVADLSGDGKREPDSQESARQDIMYVCRADRPGEQIPRKYREFLTNAILAYHRGDRATEKYWYRRVLDLLRQELPRGQLPEDLRLSPREEQMLKENIPILLRDD